MSSMLSSQCVVLATAMAVSGTVILLALRLQKSLPPSPFSIVDDHHIPQSSQQVLRSCFSPVGKKTSKKNKKKKVHFAEDVVDPRGDGENFRRQRRAIVLGNNSSSPPPKFKKSGGGGGKSRGMPENRVALYNGIMRDRVIQRLAYSY